MRASRPGELAISFTLSGEAARHLTAMARAADPRNNVNKLAKAMLLDLIADDRAAHEGHSGNAGVDRQVSA